MKAKKKDDLDFEQALKKLEALVDDMENGEIPLADLVSKYEEGNNLLKQCQKQLHQAELKIEVLKKKNEEFSLSDFKPDK